MQLIHESKRRKRFWNACPRSLLTAVAASFLGGQASGQLAITEVLSSPSANGIQRDDFWELTNFGPTPVDLSAFWFRDQGGFSGAANLAELWLATRMDPPWIGAGESILFAKATLGKLTTAEQFVGWWGSRNLPPGQKVILYSGYGFSSQSDAVQLWEVTPELTNLVQRVELFSSLPGKSFSYDRLTGSLSTFSSAGEGGAFVAAETDDVGSPGWTTGPVPLRLLSGPASARVDGGGAFTLSAKCVGLPAPHYQWRFNGSPIAGASGQSLTLDPVTSADEGEYTVQVRNGLEQLVTPPAKVTVNILPTCATILKPPSDVELTPGQTAIFHVDTAGYPTPSFQWRFNGVDIRGANSRTYAVAGAEKSVEGIYSVEVRNPQCTTNASARLSVVPVPTLMVTEAMALPYNHVALGHDTWWELTNRGTNAVNLRGYRWDDSPPSLDGALRVDHDVILEPGKSAIFVSGISPDAFRRWWGEDHLPEGLPIISYPGNGLSTVGDVIQLWNATALTDDEWLLSLPFVNREEGRSLWFDPIEAEFGEPSVEGERGAFRAAESDDIGSPGWTGNADRVVRPRVTSIHRDIPGVTVTWRSEPGKVYEVRYRSDPTGTGWTLVERVTATGDTLTLTDHTAGNASERFYKILLLP